MSRPVRKRIRDYIFYLFLKFIAYALSITPRKLIRIKANFIGWLFFHLLKKDRNIAIDNLEMLFPKREGNRRIALRSFQNASFNLFDYLSTIRKGRLDKIISKSEIIGMEKLDSIYGKSGIIVLTTHCNAFEFIPLIVANSGYKVAVIGRKLFSPSIDKFLLKYRCRKGVVNVPSDDTRLLLKTLDEKYLVGILIDQHSHGVNSTSIPFLGHNADVVTGPVKLAIRKNIPIITVSIHRDESLNYRVEFGNFVDIDNDSDLVSNLEKAVREIENIILSDIEQWIWFHDRWSKD